MPLSNYQKGTNEPKEGWSISFIEAPLIGTEGIIIIFLKSQQFKKIT
jgi:hypothetical protein